MVKVAGEKNTGIKQKQDEPVTSAVHIPVQKLLWKFPVENQFGAIFMTSN